MADSPFRIYEFESYRLDIGERLLFKDSAPVPITPKAFEILCVLVLRAGHLVSKEELLREVWRDSFVEESNLARNVYLLRKTLEEGADGQPFIQTVPRQGYRFVAGVRAVGAEAEVSPAEVGAAQASPALAAEAAAAAPPGHSGAGRELANRRPSRGRFLTYKFFIGLSILLGASAALYFFAAKGKQQEPDVVVRSLAILPFKSINEQAGDEQLGLGMADAILTKLSKLPGVSVLPTTAVFKYSGRERDPMASGRELEVDAVLDGTMQRSNDRIRVTVQLVRVRDGRTLWADKFDEPLSGILVLQDSLSEQIARTVAPQISAGWQQPTKRYSENLAAYESYLMGYFFWNRRSKENLVKAIPYLQRAVEQDPNFALARAILADCYFIDAHHGYNIYPAKESLEKARVEASKALALDESIAESHIVMAQVKSAMDGDPAAAEAEYKRGLELNPNYATGRIRYSFELFYSLRLDEAVREVRRARALDPLSPAANSALCFMLIMAREYEGAVEFGRKALELSAGLTVARVNLGEAYLRKGMYREAIDEFRRVSEDDPLRARQCLAHAYATAGERGKARALLSQLKRSPDAARLSALELATIHTDLGETDAALGILEKVSLDMETLALLHFDPQWDALRSEQRFEALLQRGQRR